MKCMSHKGVFMQEVLLHVRKLSKLIEKEPKIAKYDPRDC